MNYNETIEFLCSSMPVFEQQGATAYKPGLERITEFCRLLGNPQRNYFVVHVAGTNGKGSVSHMLASILQQAGYCTGLYTSPHLTDFRERIRVDGEMIPKQKIVNFVDKYHQFMLDSGMSFFEMTTALAFDYFAQSDVEVAVVECGLGGRLDATNVVVPLVSVITNIGLEHTAILGDTLPKIAREKAGIIKKSVPVVVGEFNDKCNLVFEEVAEDMNSRLLYAENEFKCTGQRVEDDKQVFDLVRTRDEQAYQFRLGLLGEYQRHNIITACTVADVLHNDTPLTISRHAISDGLRNVVENTSLRGRWQKLADAPLTICDTGHNAHGLRDVAEQLRHQTCRRLYCVLGFSADKNVREVLEMFPKEAHYIFTQACVKRALPAVELAEVGRTAGLEGEVVDDVPAAYARARALASEEDMIFIGGSNFVVGEIL